MKFSIITSSYNQKEQLIKLLNVLKEQTYKDFEWIITDDGSDDGTSEWARSVIGEIVGVSPITITSQPHDGYRLVEVLNNGARVARGDYLVWIMGDSYPKEDFLEQLAKVAAEDKMLSGIRMNVDEEGQIVSQDWRVNRVMFELDTPADSVRIVTPRPWELMTLNTMVMPRVAYERMGGIFPGYKGYGQMDWDMAAWAHYHGMELHWVPKAVVYHRMHTEREDTPENIEVFKTRLSSFQAPELDRAARIQEKMDIINDPERAEAKKKLIEQKRAEAAKSLEMGAEDEE